MSPELPWLSTAVSGNEPDGVQMCMAVGGLIEHISD